MDLLTSDVKSQLRKELKVGVHQIIRLKYLIKNLIKLMRRWVQQELV